MAHLRPRRVQPAAAAGVVDKVVDIAGIDYSTHYVDVVRVGDDHPPVWDRYELRGADSFDRARTVSLSVPSAFSLYWDDVLAVGIEEPAGRNPGHLFRVQGAILTRIPADRMVEKWMPSQWRKAVGLPGNCSKDDVGYHVFHERGCPVTPWPQDACDAYCIALATQKALDREAA